MDSGWVTWFISKSLFYLGVVHLPFFFCSSKRQQQTKKVQFFPPQQLYSSHVGMRPDWIVHRKLHYLWSSPLNSLAVGHDKAGSGVSSIFLFGSILDRGWQTMMPSRLVAHQLNRPAWHVGWPLSNWGISLLCVWKRNISRLLLNSSGLLLWMAIQMLWNNCVVFF